MSHTKDCFTHKGFAMTVFYSLSLRVNLLELSFAPGQACLVKSAFFYFTG